MAGDWIKMRTNLDTDPRVIELAAILNMTELHVIGCLWRLWSWADEHSEDGNALRVTYVTLDRFTCVTGFAHALKKVGWLDGEEGNLCFPNFTDHNGQTAKKRAETNKRVAKHRNANRVTNVTQKALPEKRREEKKKPQTPFGVQSPEPQQPRVYEPKPVPPIILKRRAEAEAKAKAEAEKVAQ